MRGSTHAVIGANVVWIPLVFGMTVQPWFVGVGALAALLPDLDASESKIKHLTVGGYIGHTRVRIKPFAPIAMIFSSIFGHRGPLHSLFALEVLSFGASFLIPYTSLSLWWVIMLGYASHLASDALTKAGIQFLWPWNRNVGLLPKALRVKTGGLVDSLLLLLGSGGVVIFLYQFVNTL